MNYKQTEKDIKTCPVCDYRNTDMKQIDLHYRRIHTRVCMHVNIHKNPKLDLKCKNSSLAIDFNFIKEIRKLYKGKYLIRAILLSFFTGKSNQLTVLTRLLHFHCFLDRHPYWPYIKRYGHMAIWPYCLNMAITP